MEADSVHQRQSICTTVHWEALAHPKVFSDGSTLYQGKARGCERWARRCRCRCCLANCWPIRLDRTICGSSCDGFKRFHIRRRRKQCVSPAL